MKVSLSLSVFVMSLFLSPATMAEVTWACGPMLKHEFGYECPTIGCELSSGNFHGLKIGQPVEDAQTALCKMQEKALVEKGASIAFYTDDPEFVELVFLDNFCSNEVDVTSIHYWLLGIPEPTDVPLVSRLEVQTSHNQISLVRRETRESACYLEKGL